MQIREHELMQFEALGEISEARIEALTRTWARPKSARRAERVQTRSLPELEQLALPSECGCPRLA